MILVNRVTITEEDSFESVHDKLAIAGADALTEVVERIKNGTLTRTPQPEGETYAAKIENEDCKLDFSLPARELHNIIRGLSPIPLSFTHTPDGKLLKIVSAAVASENGIAGVPGEVVSIEGGKIRVACGDGELYILGCQPEGKRRMSAADLINGRRIAVGDILTNEK